MLLRAAHPCIRGTIAHTFCICPFYYIIAGIANHLTRNDAVRVPLAALSLCVLCVFVVKRGLFSTHLGVFQMSWKNGSIAPCGRSAGRPTGTRPYTTTEMKHTPFIWRFRSSGIGEGLGEGRSIVGSDAVHPSLHQTTR